MCFLHRFSGERIISSCSHFLYELFCASFCFFSEISEIGFFFMFLCFFWLVSLVIKPAFALFFPSFTFLLVLLYFCLMISRFFHDFLRVFLFLKFYIVVVVVVFPCVFRLFS